MSTHNLYSIIAGAVTILFCSILFCSDPELANYQTISPFFALQGIMVVCACIAIVASCLGKENFTLKPTDYWVGLLLLFSTISNQFYDNSDTTKFVLLGIAYFTLRIIYQRTPHALKIGCGILMLIGIVECWLGFKQLYGFAESNHALYRLTGSFFNPGPYSGFLAAMLPIALYWMLKLYPKTQHLTFKTIPIVLKSSEHLLAILLFLIALWCFSAILMLLPASMSRSAWIAATIGCSLVLTKHYRLIESLQTYYALHKRFVLIGCALVILLLAGAGTGMYFMKKDSADGRLLMWKVSWNTIKKNPWTGSGAGRFPGAYGQMQAEYFATGKGSPQEELVAGSPEYGFNEYLQVGVEFGLGGLALFLGIISSALWQTAGSKNQGSNAVISSMAALLAFSLFSYPFQVLPLCMVAMILLAMLGNETKARRKKAKYLRGIRIFSVGLLGLSLCCIQGRNEKREAYAQWALERTYFNMNIFEETVDHYRSLYPQLKKEAVFLFEYGQCLAKTEKYHESNRILLEGIQRSSDPMFYNIMGKNYQALKLYTEAEKAFRQAQNLIPHRLYPYYLMTKMFFESGQTDKGLETGRQLLAKEPKVVSEAVREMKQEIKKAIEQAEQDRPNIKAS